MKYLRRIWRDFIRRRQGYRGFAACDCTRCERAVRGSHLTAIAKTRKLAAAKLIVIKQRMGWRGEMCPYSHAASVETIGWRKRVSEYSYAESAEYKKPAPFRYAAPEHVRKDMEL